MDAQKTLKEFKKDLDKELKQYLDLKIDEANNLSPKAAVLMEHISDLTLRGGKRIRAALLFYSYLAHGGRDRKMALLVSMSMEMAETYLLIHDDIMDDDSLRRGGTTIHANYEQMCKTKYRRKADPYRLGNSMGILAGDIACAFSNEIIANSKFKDQNIKNALSELNRVYAIEGYGQALDVFAELDSETSKNDVDLVQRLKTVPYTFEGPTKIGAILAGAKQKDIARLEQYSIDLGTAFQIQDDILGMFSSEEKLGKPVTSDLEEGKKTLLILDALEKAEPAQKEIICKNLGNKKATFSDLEDVRRVIEETGSLNYSIQLAKKLAERAKITIEKSKLKKEGKDFLSGVAEYVINREY